ncbi:hypothetical protein [Mycoplasma sp. 'Moose RK']|uniref:hypothetical protein n=1 Tax=Mycoplasma sp. 'Moose RK' TaxID=2780095 RepID=UPI0018C28ADC|nr:hypothetical protein [Mycoplasma sp. 'Moose RK']MBG0730486.1 hypothetical protein [Mycoplasma sp. 'Moose RK']MBG0730744.1 hypothetical protein [Mycoplasma sp. 'Moose RK']MBG0731050.1 hypothetical protein [Mycoplasma sp. 'Moose RK']
MDLISLFQENGLETIKSTVDNISSNTLNFLTIIFGSLVGLIGAAMIVFVITLLLQAKFAGLEKKQQIYKRLKTGIVIIGVIVILLIAGTAITATFKNLWSSFGNGLKKIAAPSATQAIIEEIQKFKF